MKYSFTILVSIVLSLNLSAQTHTTVSLSQTITNASCKGFYRYLPADYASTTKSYPLIIWVHGAGQVGQGNAADLPKVLEWGLPKIISQGGFPSSFTVNGTQHSFIVISHQFMGWPSGNNVGAMINYVSNNYRVDAERIYLMGISAGGGGVWDYASMSVANSDRVAAMIPFCGTMAPTQALAGRIAASKMPVWAFHNTYDGTVPVANSRNWVNYINSYVPAPTPAAKLTEFPVQSSNAVIAHECWSLATLPSYKPAPQGVNIYEWLLQYKRRTTIANASPVARAGNDTAIVLPAVANLNGYASTDADGIVAAYRWRKLSGPATHSFSDSTAANTVVSNLAAGTYQFELRVTDNGGATATDNITVNVYAAPAPGSLQRVLIDVGAGALTSSPNAGLYWNNITDARPGVRLTNAVTTQNIPSGLGVNIINRLDGTYSTSSNGMATGNTTGAVGDYPANATTDLALIHSSATNGTWRITGMSTSKIYTVKFWGSRTNTSAARTAEIKRSDETTWKSYTATGNTNYNNAAVFIISGKTSMDFNIRTRSGSDFSALGVVDISFAEESPGEPPTPLPNIAPVANAGSNFNIQLPVDSVLLNGCTSTDPEGAALKFKWTKISGPAAYELVNDTLCQTRLSGLLAGSYQFELAVTDTGALVGKDTVVVNVAAANVLPVANAGADQLIHLPTNTIVLNGNASTDADGNIVTYKWRKLTGPSMSFNNDAVVNPTATFSSYGLYNLELMVTDNSGGTSTDNIAITVNGLPIANAGADIDITGTAADIQLNGSASADPEGAALSYEWTVVTGTASLTNSNTATPGFIANAAGLYAVELKVTDTYLATAKDTVMISIAAANILPVANAGADQLIHLPTNTTVLNGNASTDTDGNIVTYKWKKLTGPSMSFNNDAIVNPTATFSSFGIYNIELMVTDNRGGTATDNILITVNGLPVANAGTNINITGTAADIQLNGSASSDPEGAALSYEWTVIAGAASLTNSNTATPGFIANGEGIYAVELKVTDSYSAIAKDTVIISIATENILPVANAGADRLINLPTNSTQLSGASSYDSDGTISTYKWRKITGPSASIANDAIANPTVSALSYGTYAFELVVTDNRGGIAKDTMQLIVNSLPVANAGNNTTITLPASSVTLNGSASTDVDGTIVSYSWIQTGSGASLTNATSAQATATFTSAGSYSFELTVTDNRGATAKATVAVTVLPVPAVTAKTFRVNIFGGTNPYNNAQWNNWNVVSSLTSTNFKYEDGVASSINAVMTAYGLIADNGASYAASATACPPAVLRYTSANTSYRTLTFNGMSTSKTYNLEFYGSRANTGNKTIFQVGNAYDTISTDNNLNDVARFNNIVPDNNGRILVIISRIGTWNYLSGFIVTENTTGSFARGAVEQTESLQGQEQTTTTRILSVHPNPVDNIINVNIPDDVSGAFRIQVLDMKGNIVLQKSGNKSATAYTEKINAAGLPKGMYLLKLLYGTHTKSSTIIKL